MSLKRLLATLKHLAAGVALVVGGSQIPASAGQIILTGTDAISLHGGPAAYSQALFSNLGGSSANKVLVLNNFGGGGAGYTGWSPGFVYTATLTGFNLNDYAGLFVASPGRCCGDPYTVFGSAAFDAQVSAYLAGGGSLAIENFLGGYSPGRVPNAWANILGFDPIGGLIGNGTNDGSGDPAYATAAGLTAGYPASATSGYFSHQFYDAAWFAAEGYTTMMRSPENYAVVMQKETAVAAVPLPGTLALVAGGLLAMGFVRRRS